MTAVLTVVFLALAATGAGAGVLRLLRVSGDLFFWDRVIWGFALGFGVLGWVMFFPGVAGLFTPLTYIAVIAAGLAGLVFLSGPGPARTHSSPVAPLEWALIGGIAVALFFDLLEGLSPAADADSLAYHFDLPKRFIEAGGIEFIPRATDGAVPLLVQMTYVPALGLGGELGLTLWVMGSGWAAAALFYSLARRFLERPWSLAAALIFLTTPAVLFGAGNGQVEVKITLFVMIAAIAIAEARRTGLLRYAVLAGLAVGLFMAAKYTGLIFALACGLAILLQRRWFRHGLVLSAFALVAGFQWYAWNWLNTGDPVFPLLFGILDYKASIPWDAEYAEAFRAALFAGERAIPNTIASLIAYPFLATLDSFPIFESGRTGFGPFALLALPFTVAGLWRFRDRLATHPLFVIGLIAAIYYAIWFLTGSSQRIRHILPVYPLVLVAVIAVCQRWSAVVRNQKPLALAVFLTIAIQLAGDGVFAANYAKFVVFGENRETFLTRNVSGYEAVPWINANLKPSDHILTNQRQLGYLFDMPSLWIDPADETRIDSRPRAGDPARLYRQLTEEKITHVLIYGDLSALETGRAPPRGITLWYGLVQNGCLRQSKSFDTSFTSSRTLGLNAVKLPARIYRLQGADCLDDGGPAY